VPEAGLQPGSSALLVGCDFSSSPSRKKPIVMALGRKLGRRVQLTGLERLESLDAFADGLAQPRAWLGAFDLPFGLPRELVETLGWPLQWADCMQHYASLSRAEIRSQFVGFCAPRPPGGKFAHRATDRLAGSSPSMKWVNPPVAYMLHAGVPRLISAGVFLPGLSQGDPAAPCADGLPRRLALEAYPGLLARELLGQRSYKSDARARQTPERLIARKDLVHGLEQGRSRLGLQLKVSHAQRDSLIDDASGDALDAVLCLMQAAWGQGQQEQGASLYGLRPELDRLEGWILSA